MQTTTDKRLSAVLVLFDLHTKLFNNVLADISEEDAGKRFSEKTNHIAWLAGSLVYQRYECTKLLGGAPEQPSGYELFKDWKGIQDTKYPSLEEYKKDWQLISPVLHNLLVNATEEKLNTVAPFKMGDQEVIYYDVVTFNMHREAYFIGQIGLLRRLLNYEAMKY